MAASPRDRALADPLFGPLLRHHPDVDVVLLAPEDPRDPETPTSGQEAARGAARVDVVREALSGAVEGTWSWGDPAWWPCGERGAHRYVVRGGLSGFDGDTADAVDAARARVEARAGDVPADVRVHLTPHPRGVDVRLEGPLVHLDAETAAQLVSDLRDRLWEADRAERAARRGES